MKITVDLTDGQVEFLKRFAANHYPGSDQNLATSYPIHLVQTRRERVIDPDYDNVDRTEYRFCDDPENAYESAEELINAKYQYGACPIAIVSFDDAYAADRFIDIHGEEQVIMEEADYLEAYGIEDKDYLKVSIGYYYDTVAVFFILEEARRYIKYQGHNLRHPRTYTYGPGYSNEGEYKHFWSLLFDLGTMLNNRQ
jgi:hypothetical protein